MMFPRLRLTKVFFSPIIAGKWIVFADGRSGGGVGRNGYYGGLWSSAVIPSNVGLAVAVTVMAVAVAFTVYSRRYTHKNDLIYVLIDFFKAKKQCLFTT